MGVFEATMLICFGLSWPFSIARSVHTRRVSGKTPFFVVFVCLGYLSGIVHKALYAYDWVIYLYALNMVMVMVDLVLYFRYSTVPERSA